MKKTSVALKIRNDENELLLKEIHHRVKNNLQTISSLLSLQSESISDKGAFDAVQESKNRVASMALIHQKLYQGDNLAAIEMRDYFETIGKAIIDSFGEKAEHISLNVEMKDVELDVDTAVPIGLITNELITNSIKHAFPNKQKGQIFISLSKEENGLLKLNITDNGQPASNESTVKKEKGFGTLLIQLLTTQLGGKLEKSTEAGTSTVIQFPLQEKSAA
jgi:two-component sensor histidine kinase